jgi:hypothetical protein
MMGLERNYNGEDKESIKNFGGGTSCETVTCKIKNAKGDHRKEVSWEDGK